MPRPAVSLVGIIDTLRVDGRGWFGETRSVGGRHIVVSHREPHPKGEVLLKLLPVVIGMAAGFALRRIGLVDHRDGEGVFKLVLYVFLPAVMFTSLSTITPERRFAIYPAAAGSPASTSPRRAALPHASRGRSRTRRCPPPAGRAPLREVAPSGPITLGAKLSGSCAERTVPPRRDRPLTARGVPATRSVT